MEELRKRVEDWVEYTDLRVPLEIRHLQGTQFDIARKWIVKSYGFDVRRERESLIIRVSPDDLVDHLQPILDALESDTAKTFPVKSHDIFMGYPPRDAIRFLAEDQYVLLGWNNTQQPGSVGVIHFKVQLQWEPRPLCLKWADADKDRIEWLEENGTVREQA